MSALIRFFRDLTEFIRYPEVKYLIENPDDPIPYDLT